MGERARKNASVQEACAEAKRGDCGPNKEMGPLSESLSSPTRVATWHLSPASAKGMESRGKSVTRRSVIFLRAGLVQINLYKRAPFRHTEMGDGKALILLSPIGRGKTPALTERPVF